MKNNFRQWYRYAFLLLVGFAHCTSPTLVRDVLDLPPPENVRGERSKGMVTIMWEAHANQPAAVSGYLLYYAAHSLTNVPLDAMPKVVALPTLATQYRFAFADSLPVFVHLRSRAGNGQLSLPSLPELALPRVLGDRE